MPSPSTRNLPVRSGFVDDGDRDLILRADHVVRADRRGPVPVAGLRVRPGIAKSGLYGACGFGAAGLGAAGGGCGV